MQDDLEQPFSTTQSFKAPFTGVKNVSLCRALQTYNLRHCLLASAPPRPVFDRVIGTKRVIPGQNRPPSPTERSLETQPGPSNWTEKVCFRPEMSTESQNISYRFKCPRSGAFHCTSTGLVFVVLKAAELQYKTVQWDEALLQSSGRTPAGPLFDIECPEKSVRQLHFPHCEPSDAVLSESQLSVAHITDSGMSFIDPQEITQSHVVIDVSGLSLFGLVWNWIKKYKAVSGQVLLFIAPKKPQTKRKLNMFLLPRNVSVDQVQRKQRTTTQYIDAPSTCKLTLDQHYSVLCPGAHIIQPEKAEFDMDYEPNYHPTFEIRLPSNSSEVVLTLTERGNSQVWKHKVDLKDPNVSEKNRTKTQPKCSPVAKLRSLRPDFVENVTEPVLKQLLDRLFQQKIINGEEMESTKGKARADKARDVIDVVMRKGARASSFLIKAFCELDPSSDLCFKLRS